MQSATSPDYQQLTERLGVSELIPSAAEAHGMLCGLICAGEPDAEKRWLTELFADQDPQDLLVHEAAESLRTLAQLTREQIDGPGLGFSPLLPDEGSPLRERAIGIYDWVRGFLFGLGLAGVDAASLSKQTREVFADFAAITQMDVDGLEEGDENEESLMEIEEFVWVAAMLVYEECGQREGSP
jgi:uncharacterized protein YgfB (UPF0149 family)